jgi:hypothetical protein
MRIKLECRCGSKIEVDDSLNTPFNNRYGEQKTKAEHVAHFIAETFANEHKACLAVPDCNNAEQIKTIRAMARIVQNAEKEQPKEEEKPF